MSSDRIPIAVVSNVPTPYRLHFHRRIAGELPVRLHSLFTHDDAVSGPARWKMEMPPEIGAVFFPEEALPPGIASPLRQWRLYRRITAHLTRHGIRLVVLDGYADLTRLLLLRWAKRRGLPVVLRGDSNIHSEARLPAWKKAAKRLIVGWAVRQAAGLMPMGSCGTAYFDLYGGKGKPSFVCPYEPDYDAIGRVSPEQTAAFCAKHGLADGRRRFLYCGRLVPQKRVDAALDAFIGMAGELPEWDFVVAGNGPLRGDLEAQTPDALRARIRFLGFLQMDETAACYHACDCLVLPSAYEPWALVVNEACAAGLAVVATGVVGAAAELVEDGVNGFRVPPDDAGALAAALTQVARDCGKLRAGSAAKLGAWRRKADPVAAVRSAIAHFGTRP